MAVPKRKTSKSKNGMRQAGKGLIRKMNLKLDSEGNVQMSHILIIRRNKNKKEVVKENKE